MLKRILSMLTILTLVASLSMGCGGGSAKKETTPAGGKAVSGDEVVKDPKVRRALNLAIDRTAITETVLKGGQRPATGFVPPGLLDSTGKEFRDVNGDFGIDIGTGNLEEAKKLLAEAGYPDGKGFPKLTILYNTSENHKALAESVQAMWKDNLGIKVEVQNQEWGVFQDSRHQGKFQVARAGWIGDYEDPMTFLDLWTTYSGNNDAHWYRKEYDALIEKAKVTKGPERDKAMYDAEKMLMKDNIVMPIYYYTRPLLIQSHVKNWYHSMLGHFYFGNAETKNGVLNFNIFADPKTIDPGLNSANDGGQIINNLYEGLMRKDKGGLHPAAVEKYEVSEDGLTYTFHLRDAKWSDGVPVKAQDFEYAWKRALEPATASEYAFQLYYIKGGKAYNEKKGKAEDLGIKVIDDKTLQVTLESPTPYFLDLLGFYTYMPVRKDMIEKDKDGWTKKPETAVSNGPFMMKQYKTGDRIIMVQNPNYWGKDAVKIKQINAMMIVDQSTALTAFEAGEIDVMDDVPNQEIPRLLAEKDTFQIVPYVGTYYFIFNIGDKK